MLPELFPEAQAHLQVERAIDDLRRQNGVWLTDPRGNNTAIFPLEYVDERLLQVFKQLAGSRLQLLLTGARMVSSGLASQPIDAQIAAESLDVQQLRTLADPLADRVMPAVTPVAATLSQQKGLALSKYASLLPALLSLEFPAVMRDPLFADWLSVSVDDITTYQHRPLLKLITGSAAPVPIISALASSVFSFHAQYSTSVHVALVVGDSNQTQAPLVRVHSSCVTGDMLGSLRCDCGGQLQAALTRISDEGGILLYLHQEGRGIGITNKLRAYQLQERGFDTYQANRLLGYDEDERDFSIAGAMLQALAISRIRLLTNNTRKMHRLEHQGIAITERVSLTTAGNKHNQAYLAAKRQHGHILS